MSLQPNLLGLLRRSSAQAWVAARRLALDEARRALCAVDTIGNTRSSSGVAMITVSPAAREAQEAIIGLLSAQLAEHEIHTPTALLREVVESVLSEWRHGFILLAWDDGEAVGVSYAASHLSAEHGGIVGWLEELYVCPGSRGRGVGSALLGATVARAQGLGWRGLELEVVEGHERAAALYLRHGFGALRRTRYTRLFSR